MAIVFVPGQVATSDPNAPYPNPTAGSNIKEDFIKVVKLSSANFTTGGTNTLVASLPADASILGMRFWVKTQLAGGGITAASINIGSASGGTQFASAYSAFGTAGTYAMVSPITGIMQNYNPPYSTDIGIWVGGTATTGNPTSGELYLIIEYCR